MNEAIIIGAGFLALAVLISAGILSGKVELRPFRTSAVAFGVGLLVALWITITVIPAEGYAGGLIDGTLIGIVFTAFATAITKLSDDGGESDVVKVVTMFSALFEKMLDRDTKDKK